MQVWRVGIRHYITYFYIGRQTQVIKPYTTYKNIMKAAGSTNWNFFYPLIYQSYVQASNQLMNQYQHRFQERQNGGGTIKQQQVCHLPDIGRFTFQLIGQVPASPIQQTHHSFPNRELEKRIAQYTQSNKNTKQKLKDRRSRQKDNRSADKKRKIRTTITPQKLKEMNVIFSDYLQKQNNGDEYIPRNNSKVQVNTNLKDIGDMLRLGYSTILHKYREFRATRKVKGGALIQAMHHKRKYKKSKEIQQLIQQAITSDQKFYTAVQLAQYIRQKYGRHLSRSIISRHLGDMGYSYKNVKNKSSLCNSNTYKQLRQMFACAFLAMRDTLKARIYFVDQVCLGEEDSEIWVLLMMDYRRVINYRLQNNPFDVDSLKMFLDEGIDIVSKMGAESVINFSMEFQVCLDQQLLQYRKEVSLQNVRFYYYPPHSRPLDFLGYLLADMKSSCKLNQYRSVGQLISFAQKYIHSVSQEQLREYEDACEQYFKKATSRQNF